MLIIFDLDDTLIDTSGTIIPRLLKNALHAMRSGGLVCRNFDHMYQEFLTLDRASFSSDQALRSLVKKWNAPKECYELGFKEIYEKPTYPRSIHALPHAIKALRELAHSHRLALVTTGKQELQEKKMRLARIPIHVFSDVHFCERNPISGQEKKKFYAAIEKRTGISPHFILVCGDRISSDLSPAKELGYTTLHIKWGRGLGNTGLKKDVDYTILCLGEVASIVRAIEIKIWHVDKQSNLSGDDPFNRWEDLSG